MNAEQMLQKAKNLRYAAKYTKHLSEEERKRMLEEAERLEARANKENKLVGFPEKKKHTSMIAILFVLALAGIGIYLMDNNNLALGIVVFILDAILAGPLLFPKQKMAQ